MLRRHMVSLTGLHAAALIRGRSAAAQNAAGWPSAQPVRIIITYPPGGTTDFLARLLARNLGEILNQTVIVENRHGGNGTVGWTAVARSRPDGYTLLLIENSIATTIRLLPPPGFDVRAELAPVALVSEYPTLIAVPRDFPARTLPELVQLARQHPDSLNFGSMGNGSSAHLYMETLQELGGFRMTHVPYRGLGPALLDLIAIRVQVLLVAPPTILSALQDGQVRGLAIGTRNGRIPLLPQVPTAREVGIDYTYTYWHALFGPHSLDPELSARILQAVREVLARPEVRDRFAEQGGIPLGQDAATLGRLLDTELTRWTRMVREMGITP